MARYGKIDRRIWGDERFQRLTFPPSGAGLFLFFLSAPMATSLPGLIRAGLGTLADELGWDPEALREAFAEGLREGLWRHDQKARLIWLPNAIKYNPPESPNVVRNWRIPWDETPECELKREAWQRLKAFTEGMGEAFAKAFTEALPEGYGESVTVTVTVTEAVTTTPRTPLPPDAPPAGAGDGARRPSGSGTKAPGPDEAFVNFWTLYPKKVGKGSALAEWRRLSAVDRAAALAKVGEFAAAWIGATDERRQYIVDPERWLKRRRWEDDPAEWKRQAASGNGHDEAPLMAANPPPPAPYSPMRIKAQEAAEADIEHWKRERERLGIDPPRKAS